MENTLFFSVTHFAEMGWEEVEVVDGDTVTIVMQGFANDYLAEDDISSRRQWDNIDLTGWRLR